MAHHSIKKNILTYSVLYFTILTTICCIFYFSSTKLIFHLIEDNTKSLLKQAANSLNREISQISEIAVPITSSSNFYHMREHIHKGLPALSPEEYIALYEKIDLLLRQNSQKVSCVALYLSDGSIKTFRSNYTTDFVSPQFDISSFSELAPYTMHWISREHFPYQTSGSPPPYSLIEILGSSNTRQNGFFLIGVHDNLFLEQIKNSRPTPNSCITVAQGGHLLYNDSEIYGNATLENLSTTDLSVLSNKLTSKPAKQGETLFFHLTDNYIFYTPINLENTFLIAVIPEGEMYVDYNKFSHIIILLICILTCSFWGLYCLLTKTVSKPVTRLLSQIENVDPEHISAHPITVSGSKEIQDISSVVNRLLFKIKELICALKSEMQAKQNSQLQALYAQINPHFLYNTLDSIQQLCELGETESASKMITELALFYRISVSKGHELISLRQEISHVSAYLAILQTRFKDFSYNFQIPEEYLDCQVLKLCLQPLAENALYHGLRPFRSDGSISISAQKDGKNLILTVQDDGLGMEDDSLSHIKESLCSPLSFTEQTLNVYGLKNVHDRIRLTFGEEYGLSIDSVYEVGTIVKIRLPYQKER